MPRFAHGFREVAFATGGFMPHGYCYRWVKGLVWLHGASDVLIFMAYMTIPVTLAYIVYRRKDLPFNWMFACFGIFIVACGFTHALEVWNLWHAMYWLAGIVKAVTAVASVLTAILLIHLVPQALKIPTADALRVASEAAALQLVATRTSDESLRLLVAGVKEYAMLMLDPLGHVTSWNEGAERIKGYRADEIIGEHFSKFYTPEDVADGKPSRELKIAAEQGSYEEEGWRVRKDGSHFMAYVVITAQRDDSGRLRGFGTLTRDMTERKAAEKLLRMETQYRGLLESAPDAMVIVNQLGEIVLVNAQTEKVFRYDRNELIGQQVTRIIPNGFEERLIIDGTKTSVDALADQIGTGIELAARRKDGSEFPIEIMLSPLETSEGVLVATAIRDVTERKRANEALREQAKVLDLATVMVRDSEGRISLWTMGSQQLYGYTQEEAVGRISHELLQTHFPEPLEQIERELDRMGTWEGELSHRKRNGTRVVVASVWVLHRDAEGQPLRIMESNADITERKQSEEHLLKTAEELKQSNDQLEQFAYVASHDLQEPLRMVASFTQLLSKRYHGRLDADADEFISHAVDGCNRMKGLIRDLLTYSRSGMGGKPLREVSGETALTEALANLRVSIEENEAIVTHDSLPIFTTDETQLVQVFQNLVGNAIKYRGSAVPRVHISASKVEGNEWVFSVRDNGIGIGNQYFERIFIIFQRLHGQQEFDGTGIGLAICKKIVEHLGGRIWVESQPGQGSTFYFSLPESVSK